MDHTRKKEMLFLAKIWGDMRGFVPGLCLCNSLVFEPKKNLKM